MDQPSKTLITRASSQQHRPKWRCHCSTGSSTFSRKRLLAKKSSRGLENCWALVFQCGFVVAVVFSSVFMHWLIHWRITTFYTFFFSISSGHLPVLVIKKKISGLSVNLEASNFFRYGGKTLSLTEHQYHSGSWLNFLENWFPFYEDNFKPLCMDWKFLPIQRN